MIISSKNAPIIIAINVAVLSVAVGITSIFSAINFFNYDRYDKNDFIDSDAYQAIFLTNDQTYFGRLKNINSSFLLLSDVYYVKLNTEGTGQMIKLGAIEPHGPKDTMIINKDQVLFWENLKFDSQVVKTIQNIQSQRK